MLVPFQSTRPRGARPEQCIAVDPNNLFQSTRPRGARPSSGADTVGWIVSIHAPTGGATVDNKNIDALAGFNPRAHGGRDLLTPPPQANFQQFQSTRPRGARHLQTDNTIPPLGFNPRAHGGRDGTDLDQVAKSVVSIHAPTGGATLGITCLTLTTCFNPRAHGGRDFFFPFCQRVTVFQSTRPRGARQAQAVYLRSD